MANPRRSSCLHGHWSTKLIPVLSVLILYIFLSAELVDMHSSPKYFYLAALTASLARQGKAQGASNVSLSWYAPNATAINNLTQVIEGSGIYGYIYNGSDTPAAEYGVYNWCNMPHVRATEYKKPSAEYKLEYVEVVSIIS